MFAGGAYFNMPDVRRIMAYFSKAAAVPGASTMMETLGSFAARSLHPNPRVHLCRPASLGPAPGAFVASSGARVTGASPLPSAPRTRLGRGRMPGAIRDRSRRTLGLGSVGEENARNAAQTALR